VSSRIKKDDFMWEFFDHVYCLTTNQNSERMAQLRVNLHQIHLYHCQVFQVPSKGRNIATDPSKTSFLDILRYDHSTVGEVGRNIVENELTLVRYALEQGAKNVLIFEDDASFDIPVTLKMLPHIVDWLKSHEWEMFNFGAIAFPFPICMPVATGVALATRPRLGHACALNKSGMQQVLAYSKQINKPIHMDQLYASTFKRYHVAYPPICFQTVKPALFRQAMDMLPTRVRNTLDRGDFRTFCMNYFYMSHAIALLIAAGLIFQVAQRAKCLYSLYKRKL
jgi:hypothetical protein